MKPGLVVKLRPSGPWRIGPDSGARNRVDAIYHSDSLYSAVTSAMSRMGKLEAWLDATARNATPAVCFSSCFPFVEEMGFVIPPRTLWPPTSPSRMAGRVRWKSARFISLGMVQAILAGEPLDENRWSVDGPSGCLVPAGTPGPFRTAVRWGAAVDRLSGASERHSTACIEFRPGAGLWTVVGFADEAARDGWQDAVKAAFRLLADTGFGGERSRGWGRSESPEFVEGELPGMIIGEERAQEGKSGGEEARDAGQPLADARGSDQSRDRTGALASQGAVPRRSGESPSEDAANEVGEPEAGEWHEVQSAGQEARDTAAVEAEKDEMIAEGSPAESPSGDAANEAAAQEAGESRDVQSAGQDARDTAPHEAEKDEMIAEGSPAESPSGDVANEAAAQEADESQDVQSAGQEARDTEGGEEEKDEMIAEGSPAESLSGDAANEAAAQEADESRDLQSAGQEARDTEGGEEEVGKAQVAAPPVIAALRLADEPSPVPPVQEPPSEQPPAPEPPVGDPQPEIEEPGPPPPEPVPDRPQALASRPVPSVNGRASTRSHWLLSLFTPAAADTVDWARGNYTVLARGGRVDSPAGSGELKKQIQMVAEGSVLIAEHVPLGAAADVAPDGFAHPVFRAGFALAITLPEAH